MATIAKTAEWFNGTANQVTPVQSQSRALVFSCIVGLVGFMFMGWATHRFDSIYANLIAAFIGFGAVAIGTSKTLPTANVGVQKQAVKLFLGRATHTILSMGQHVLIWGESAAAVFVGPIFFDPPVFEELTGDEVGVAVDGYFVAHVRNPFRWFTQGGPQTGPELKKKFVSKIRTFIQPFPKAVDIVNVRNMISEFVMLRCNNDVAADAFAERLRNLKDKSGATLFNEDTVKSIMEGAGGFCQEAAKFGYYIDDVNTENVNLPAELLAAARQRAALGDILASFQERQRVRLEMIKEMKAELPKLPQQDVVTAVDMLLGLAVTRRVEEINLRGLERFVDSPVAVKLMGLLDKHLKKGS